MSRLHTRSRNGSPLDCGELLSNASEAAPHAAGLLPTHCQECGIAAWRGRPLPLELHHVNGDGRDNSLSNLALLCPNCHSQTDSWGGRNSGSREPESAPPSS